MIKSISDITKVLYINLESRTDRKKHVENQLSTIGFKNFQRFKAIKMDNGALGCSISHLKCLQIAKANNWEHVLICEDDIEFLDQSVFTKQLNGFLETVDDWDVILLAGNNMRPYKITNKYSVKVYGCQTTTGYIVKKSYYDKLIENYLTGIKNLFANPQNHKIFAIDQFWMRLQEKDNWFLITPLSVIQRADYSDIEKKNINYKYVMTMLNK